MKLSVCIITKNERKKLEKCLQHLSGYEFEIVVVDTGSTDGTLSMVKNYTDSFYEFEWCDDFSKAKNYAISKAKNDTILMLDSDEYIININMKILEKVIKEKPKELGKIFLKNYVYQGTEIGEKLEYVTRIFNRNYYRYEGKIHEQLVPAKKGDSIKTYKAPIQADHDGYLLTYEEKQKKADRNITMLKRALEEEGEDPYILYQLGKSYYMAENYAVASEYLGKALWFELDERLEYVIDLVETYGYSLLNAGQISEAMKFEGLIEYFGNTSDFLFLMGLIYMNNEYYSEAIQSFLNAVSLKNARSVGTDSYLAYYNAGVICECLMDMEQAMNYYWKCEDYLPALKRIGLYYEEKNPTQAYLFYHQMTFLYKEKNCDDLKNMAKDIKQKYNIEIPKSAIVILSYNTLEETKECIESIRKYCAPDRYELVVVDNASADGSAEWLEAQKDIKLLCNKENTGFPKGCNQGIELAEKDSDIWLLNSDTLVPPNALFWLQMGLYESEKTGAAGSVSNYAPNYQNIKEVTVTAENYLEYANIHEISITNPYEKKSWLVGFSLLLKRKALEKIGLLDERFSPGNYEDTDIGFRLLEAGYEQNLCKNSFAFHYGSRSFSKKKTAFLNLLEINQQKFIEKWGIHPSRFSYIKTWEIGQILHKSSEEFSVLDIGCGMGATMARIQSLYPNARINGIEKKEKAAEMANKFAPTKAADVVSVLHKNVEKKYDYILTGGIWEHIKIEEVSNVLAGIRIHANENASITGSIYNRNHPWEKALPKDCLSSDIGIADCEHISGYTAEEWIDILNQNGIKIEKFTFAKNSAKSSIEKPYQYFWKGYFV